MICDEEGTLFLWCSSPKPIIPVKSGRKETNLSVLKYKILDQYFSNCQVHEKTRKY